MELQAHRMSTTTSDDGLLLWIDQISIDQKSIAEKNHQVRQMATIFSDAVQVIAWLGPSDDESDQAFEYMKAWAKNLGDNHDPNVFSEDSNEKGREFSIELACYVRSILERAYWDRIWTVQEFSLARTLNIQCGESILKWDDLHDFMYRDPDYTLGPGNQEKYDNVFMSHILIRDSTVSGEGYIEPLECILNCSGLRCTDSRDKVYFLLGLPTLRNFQVQVDYNKSPSEVFWDCVEAAERFSASKFKSLREYYTDIGVQKLIAALGVSQEDPDLIDLLEKLR